MFNLLFNSSTFLFFSFFFSYDRKRRPSRAKWTLTQIIEFHKGCQKNIHVLIRPLMSILDGLIIQFSESTIELRSAGEPFCCDFSFLELQIWEFPRTGHEESNYTLKLNFHFLYERRLFEKRNMSSHTGQRKKKKKYLFCPLHNYTHSRSLNINVSFPKQNFGAEKRNARL